MERGGDPEGEAAREAAEDGDLAGGERRGDPAVDEAEDDVVAHEEHRVVPARREQPHGQVRELREVRRHGGPRDADVDDPLRLPHRAHRLPLPHVPRTRGFSATSWGIGHEVAQMPRARGNARWRAGGVGQVRRSWRTIVASRPGPTPIALMRVPASSSSVST